MKLHIYQLAFIAFILSYIISSTIIIFSQDTSINNIALAIIILSVVLFVIFINESQKQFKEEYNSSKQLDKKLDKKSKFNFYYHPIINDFFSKDEEKLTKEDKVKIIEDLIIFSNIDIEEKTNGFLSSPLVVLIISFASAIIVNIITGGERLAIDEIKLITLVIIIIFSLFIMYMLQGSLLINKIISFKKFLNKFKYDEIV